MVVSILFIIGLTVAVVMCRIYRQRTFMSMASRAHQPNQTQFSPYPTVQYSSSPQPAANVYQGAAGYPPPSGYGVQPPGTGYSTSQPVATGYIYQPFTDHSGQPSGMYTCICRLIIHILPHEALNTNFIITKICPCNKQRFLSFKNLKFSAENFLCFSYFCSKHILWVHVRTASPRRF